MKVFTAIVGAGTLCAVTDGFVAPTTSVRGNFALPTSPPLGSSTSAVSPRSGAHVMMSLGGGGSKKSGSPKGVPSKIIDIFRGNKNKG